MARLRNKCEQREYVRPRAMELARSGYFRGWLPIEHHLRFEELCPEARHVLDDERIREELDNLCIEARKTMKISDMIELLRSVQSGEGDLNVRVYVPESSGYLDLPGTYLTEKDKGFLYLTGAEHRDSPPP